MVVPFFVRTIYFCSDLETEDEMHATMYELIQRFPKANKELLERVIVHLSRYPLFIFVFNYYLQ